jgi:hypothetical protein
MPSSGVRTAPRLHSENRAYDAPAAAWKSTNSVEERQETSSLRMIQVTDEEAKRRLPLLGANELGAIRRVLLERAGRIPGEDAPGHERRERIGARAVCEAGLGIKHLARGFRQGSAVRAGNGGV